MSKQSENLNTEDLQSLGNHPLIDLLPNTTLGKQAKMSLLNKVTINHYRKNQNIFLQHDQVFYLYFLLSGIVS